MRSAALAPLRLYMRVHVSTNPVRVSTKTILISTMARLLSTNQPTDCLRPALAGLSLSPPRTRDRHHRRITPLGFSRCSLTRTHTSAAVTLSSITQMATLEERHPELFRPVSNESPRGKKRTVPLECLCLGFNRTGTACKHTCHYLETPTC